MTFRCFRVHWLLMIDTSPLSICFGINFHWILRFLSFKKVSKMVKLTPELINASMQYINPCRDRELDLRGKYFFYHLFKNLRLCWLCFGNSDEFCFFFLVQKYTKKCFKWIIINLFNLGYKIPQIENMGATLDQFDTIDFSDNDLRRLDGFPYLPRIKCLLLNNNRIV